MIVSQLGRSDATSVHIGDLDLASDLMGTASLTDMVYLMIRGRLPSDNERRLLDACMVGLVDHGMTPSVMATRLTYLGSPESLQGAVAAGLLGLGSVFVGSIEGCARMLQETVTGEYTDLGSVAEQIVDQQLRSHGQIPGLGHPVHTPVDPRAERLLQLASGRVQGSYVTLMHAVRAAANERLSKNLVLNVTGAIGAVLSELGFDWQIVRGVGLVARCAGLVGHLAEEQRNPAARAMWRMVEADVSVDSDRDTT